MALSGTINGTVPYNDDCYDFYAEWSAVQSIANNSSDVTVTTFWKKTGNKTFDTATGKRPYSITIDGETSGGNKTFDCSPFPSNNIYEIHTFTKTVKHENNGEKTITISARANGKASTYGPSSTTASSGDCTLSDEITLTTIPREAKITSAPNFTDMDNPKISYSNILGNDANALDVCIANAPTTGSSQSIVPYRAAVKTGSSYTFNLTANERILLREHLGNQKSKKVRFYIRTKIEDTYFYNNKEVTLTMAESDASKPEITAVTLEPIDGFNGLYIQNISAVNVSIDYSLKCSATFKRLTVNVDNTNYSTTNSDNITSSQLKNAQKISVIVTVTDSRDFTDTYTTEIEVISYYTPRIKSTSNDGIIYCYRGNAAGDVLPQSNQIYFAGRKDYSKVISNETQYNYCKLQYRQKEKSVEWGNQEWTTLLDTDSENDFYTGILPSTYNVKNAYTLQFRTVDDVGNASVPIEFDIPTENVVAHMAKSKKGIGIGCYADDVNRPYSVVVVWNTYLEGNVYIGEDNKPLADYISDICRDIIQNS